MRLFSKLRAGTLESCCTREQQLVWGAVLVVTAGLLWLYFGPLLAQVELWGDGERDLLKAWALAYTDWAGDGGPGVMWASAQPDLSGDGQPMVSHLQDITLGPFWYVVVSLFIPFAAAVSHVYTLHVLLFVVGLVALFRVLWRRYGVWEAVSACVLLALSVFVARTLRVVWHPAMLPAFACFWFVSVSYALNAQDLRARSRWLVAAWVVQAVMLQLNLVAAPYGAALGVMQLHHWWRGGWRVSPVANLLCLGLLIALGWFCLRVGLTVLEGNALASTEGVPKNHSILDTLITMFGSAWVEGTAHGVNHTATGWLVALMAVVGVGFVFRPSASAFERWTAFQVVLGLLILIPTMSVGTFPRYIAAIVPGTFVLFASGVHAVRFLSRWIAPCVLVLVCVLNVFDPVRGAFLHINTTRSFPSLGVVEQEVLFQRLDHGYDMNWTDVRQRVHGLEMVALSNRYVSLASGLVGKASSTTIGGDHFIVALEGDLQTIESERQDVFDGGTGRNVVIHQKRPRFDHQAVRFLVDDQPCVGTLPYRRLNHQLPLELMHKLGFPPDASEPNFVATTVQNDDRPEAAQPCWLHAMPNKGNVLTLVFPPIVGDRPLTLAVLGDANLLNAADQNEAPPIQVEYASGSAQQPHFLSRPFGASYVLVSIPVQAGQSMTLRLPDTWAVNALDVY